IATEDEWQAFCSVIGAPDWTKDPRFSDAYARHRNQDELDKRVEEWTNNQTPYQAMRILQKVGVAAFPSLDSQGLSSDRHLKERGMFTEVEHPVMGRRIVIAPHWKFSHTPASSCRHAPLLAEHNEYVFGELLGMPLEEITELQARGIIY
ncbi:MAG: CoA transferase, partial [Dehalococcoidia bacterium]|nr:CoA transferase [Dehalococcoidia bacterium]